MEASTITTATSEHGRTARSIEAVAHELAGLFQTEANVRTVFGEPLALETRKVIPIVSIEIGAGGGGGFGQGITAEALQGVVEVAKKLIPLGRGAGGGGALAIKVRPIGYLTEENGRVVFTAIPMAAR